MALLTPYTDAHGVDHPEAYGRINYYSASRELGQPAFVHYVIEVYASNAARRAGKRPLATVAGRMDYDDQGPVRLSDIYAHAHTLPEFAGAADV